jgi:hypothetical protein
MSTGEDEVNRDEFRQAKKDQKVRRKLIKGWGGKVPENDGHSSEEDSEQVKWDREYCKEMRRRSDEAIRLGTRYKNPRYDDDPQYDPDYDENMGKRGRFIRSSPSP